MKAKKKVAKKRAKPKDIPDKRNEELKQIARDIVNNLIFTDRHIQSNYNHMLTTIFTPLLFVTKKTWGCDHKDIGIVYEYYDKQLPRSINGYPMFGTCRFLLKKESNIVMDYVKKYKDAIKEI